MISFTHENELPKGLALLVLFITLCTSIIFVPELSMTTSDIPVSTSICRTWDDCSLLTTPFSVDSDLCRTKPNRDDKYNRRLSEKDKAAFLRAYAHSTLSHNMAFHSIQDFDNENGFQQACQILDIPPPHNVFSI
jgi:hypothetical protein